MVDVRPVAVDSSKSRLCKRESLVGTSQPPKFSSQARRLTIKALQQNLHQILQLKSAVKAFLVHQSTSLVNCATDAEEGKAPNASYDTRSFDEVGWLDRLMTQPHRVSIRENMKIETKRNGQVIWLVGWAKRETGKQLL